MYALVKIWVRTGLRFYCGKVTFEKRDMYNGNHPLILACSHPNSFFDALVMGAYHPRQLHFLARGDAFKNPKAARVLRMLNMIPIYRLSEGKENLDNNKQTFEQCMHVLKNKGAILIFSEGISVNEWRLRPLKKGTARLAWMFWEEHNVKDMVVQPVGINYHSFAAIPKKVYVEYAPVISSPAFNYDNTAVFYKQFNNVLTERLAKVVLNEDSPLLAKRRSDNAAKLSLAIPALAGYVLHRAFFVQWRRFIRSKTKDTVFFDSVLFGSLIIIYPILVLLITIAAVVVSANHWYWLLFVLIPFTAWSYKRFKSL
ncbi:MAG: 1-acyl-sn-glycerol-3-phosphate acyltransferase [Chitinophagaceae bacterium]|nr:1-acyl-sn-glycerol-3-phosphate acyltransferase [Chitinophagaceae bacterium]MCB9046564.1 1-acyl-sn-glycerol-3-phosphate acyltransferase [Chitinophagales bacterium]